MPFYRKALSLSLILMALLASELTTSNQASAAVVLHHDFVQAIDDNAGSVPGSPLQWWSNYAQSSLTTNVADSNANDGKVARLTLPAGVPAGPESGPNMQTKQRYQYGTFQTRIKAAACSASIGAITGVFTYFNDGSDTNGNGLPDNSEIDFEWLCAEPQVMFITMWTDYNPSNDAHKRVYREIDLATGTIRQTCYAETFGNCTSLANSPTENQPTSVPAIPGYSSSTAYYQVGFTWSATEVVWFIIHPTTGAKIILWDYKGPSSRITKVPAYYMINTWHTNNWTPTQCCANAIGSPTSPLNTYVDWLDITNDTVVASSTPTQTKTNTPVATKTNTPTPTKTNTIPPSFQPPTSTVTPTTTVGGNGAPYGGTPAAIPGTVQAENYNTGGQGVAYNDAETANQGGAYRTGEGVDVEPCTDTGCGYDVGYAIAGEWMKYTVNVTAAGTYTANFRVASAVTGGAFHLEVDNVNVTGTISVPNTGGWDTWTTLAKTGISLTAGQHVLKLVTETNDSNYNWFSLTTNSPTPTRTNTATATVNSGNGAPYGGTAAAIPGTVQAENYNTGGQGIAYNDAETANQGGSYRTIEGVDIEPCTDTGCGYNVGYAIAGEWMKYTVNVTAAGTYTANFRVASAMTGGAFHLEVDNVNVTGTLTVPNTGGWDTWTTLTKTGITLSAGQHVLKLVTDAPNGNYNWFSIQ